MAMDRLKETNTNGVLIYNHFSSKCNIVLEKSMPVLMRCEELHCDKLGSLREKGSGV